MNVRLHHIAPAAEVAFFALSTQVGRSLTGQAELPMGDRRSTSSFLLPEECLALGLGYVLGEVVRASGGGLERRLSERLEQLDGPLRQPRAQPMSNRRLKALQLAQMSSSQAFSSAYMELLCRPTGSLGVAGRATLQTALGLLLLQKCAPDEDWVPVATLAAWTFVGVCALACVGRLVVMTSVFQDQAEDSAAQLPS